MRQVREEAEKDQFWSDFNNDIGRKSKQQQHNDNKTS